MFNLNDQLFIVTGGTRGIGAGISRYFLDKNATVIATYHSNDQASENFKHSLGELGEKLILKKFDVANEDHVQAFYEEINQKFEALHVLVNNSGIRMDNLTASMSLEAWDKVMDTNLKGSFLMSKHAVLKMMQNRYGRIINISSIGGMLGLAGQANYAASKAGQIALSKVLAKEVAKRNITVNNVAPGFIETELLEGLSEDQIKAYKNQVPLKRFGKVSEVASTVGFLASAEASYITGTTIEVTGGL